MQKDFVTATPDTGGAGGTTVNVKASPNSGAARNTTITVSGGGVSKQVSISQAAGQQVTVTGFTGGNKWYHPGSAVGDKIPVPGSITMDIAPGEGIISGSLTFDRVITSAKITDDYGDFAPIGFASGGKTIGFGSDDASEGDYQTIELQFQGFTGVLNIELACRE